MLTAYKNGAELGILLDSLESTVDPQTFGLMFEAADFLWIERVKEVCRAWVNDHIFNLIAREGSSFFVRLLAFHVQNPHLGICDIHLTHPRNGWTLLMYTIIRKRKDVFDLLVRAGVNLEQEVGIENTALTEAIIRNDLERVAWLLEAGAYTNREDYEQALEWGVDSTIITLLKQAGA